MFSKYIEMQDDMMIVSCIYDGLNVIGKIKEHKPDLLLLDIAMPEKDGLAVLDDLIADKSIIKPDIIMMSSIGQERVTQKAISLGALYYVVKPFNFEIMVRRIRDFSKKEENMLMERANISYGIVRETIEKRVTEIIRAAGIPAHIKGYKYLREAILLVIKDDDAIESITKMLYPTLANIFKTTPTRIERAIRHSIEVAWNRGNVAIQEDIFGYTVNSNNGKPTNSEFIAMIADKLVLEDRQSLTKAV